MRIRSGYPLAGATVPLLRYASLTSFSIDVVLTLSIASYIRITQYSTMMHIQLMIKRTTIPG